jgi:hypothetical protein
MGDTLTIYGGSFFDPILELMAVDSDLNPPSVLHLVGRLVTADSMAGTFEWSWDRCEEEGIWYLVRSSPDTGAAFANIVGFAYRQESMSGVESFANLFWQINEVSISGATISVNGVPLTDYGDGFYSTQLGAITVVPSGDYFFNIFHPEYGSTTRTAHVPSDYAVTSPVEGAVIPRGQNLIVTFTQASNATFYDAYLQANEAYTWMPAPATSLNLSGTNIQTAGEDVLHVKAVCGDYQTFTGFFGINGKAINVTVQ